MPFVDAHAHIYPEKIATKAMQSVADFYTMRGAGGGSSQWLLERTADSPITHFIVHSVAVKTKTVESINNFIAEECKQHPEFVGFGSMHQDYEDKEAEVNRCIELGLHGFKIHPDTQQVYVDDPRMMEFYEIIEGRLPIVIHTGDYRYDYSHPSRVKKVLRTFPNLVVDAAHFGGWSIYDIGYDWLGQENCFVDTSSSGHWIGQRHMKELINMFGTERVMFGSDHPLFDPYEEAEFFCGIKFSEDEFENLTWHNAERFSGVKIG